MQFYVYIIYIGKVRFAKSSMWTIHYIDPIWLIATHLQRVALRNMCTKLHQDSSKTETLVWQGYFDFPVDAGLEYIYFMVSVISAQSKTEKDRLTVGQT